MVTLLVITSSSFWLQTSEAFALGKGRHCQGQGKNLVKNRSFVAHDENSLDDDSVVFSMESLEPSDENNGSSSSAQNNVPLDSMERAWRYAKKPLLSIGSKGATLTHGNSLRQLLAHHTVVKVKVNTRRYGGSLQSAFEQLRSLAEQNGAPPGIEMIQARESDHIILFGQPGTMDRISNDDFPPPETTRKEGLEP